MANLNRYRTRIRVPKMEQAGFYFYAPSGYILLVTSRSVEVEGVASSCRFQFYNWEGYYTGSKILDVTTSEKWAFSDSKIAISDTEGISFYTYLEGFDPGYVDYVIIGYLL